MHELGIAQSILEIVQQSVPEEEKTAVRKVRIRVGQLSGVVPDSLDFCFRVVAGEMNMPQAVLDIEQLPTISRCRDCQQSFNVEEFVFVCPSCKSANLEIISGKELEIVDIQLAEDSDNEGL